MSRFEKSTELPVPDLVEIDPSNPRFQPVDMLFNIGRLEGEAPRGDDLIDKETGQRFYLTHNSDPASEELVIARYGAKSILKRLGINQDTSVYQVPVGSRLLLKTLEAAPYSEAYMRRLQERASVMLDDLTKLDKNRFGIDISHIAVAHNGRGEDVDDTYLTIVPPLKSPAGGE